MGGFYIGKCPRIAPFLENNGAILGHSPIHTQMEDKERKTPIDFGVKRSKVKVIVTCPPAGPSLTVSVF